MPHPHQLTQDLNLWLSLSANRRHTLRWLGLAGSAALLGCGGGSDDSSDSSTSGTTTDSSSDTSGSSTSSGSSSSSSSTCSTIPSETAGPYPGDGTNSNSGGVANALLLSGIVRSDIRASLTSTTVADGVPLTITLQLVNSNASCASLAGYAIYLWHCDRSGNYSMYSSGVTADSFLRGVQVTDSSGKASFTTIFPGCYSGRYPHVHFEVYPSLAQATSGNNDIKTSQLTFQTAAMDAVYATSAYSTSASNYAATSLSSDNVFSDDQGAHQIATTSGSVSAGYSATLQVGVAV